MKQTEWKHLVRGLLPADQTWSFRGTLVYRAAPEWVLQGIHAESSAFDKRTYVSAVTMPLFVPTDVVDLSYAHRIGGGSHSYSDDDVGGLTAAITGAINEIQRDDPLAVILGTPAGRNWQVAETHGYAWILQGDLAAGRKSLTIAAEAEVTRDWEAQIIERARLVLGMLDTGGSDEAVEQLRKWRDATCAALGIS